MSRPDYVPDDAEDITDHGAAPNPDDDSTSAAEANRDAIHAAANASSGTNVYVPEGVFYIGRDGSRTIRFGEEADPGGSIYGAGPDVSVIAASSAAETSRTNTLIQYRGGEDHGEVEIRGIALDGNASEMDNPGDAIDCRGDHSLSMRLERVYIHDIYMRGIRARDVDLEVYWCTFENIAIERNAETDGSSISHAISWGPDDGHSLHVERTLFRNVSGNPINDSAPETTITVEWCYAEGIGTGWTKLTAADITFRHCYARPHTPEFADMMTSDHDGRKAMFVHDGQPAGVHLDNFVVEDTTEFGIGVRRDYELEISGDKALFRNIGFDRENRGCFWERRSSDTIRWDDFGEIWVDGVSLGSDPAFTTDSGGGSIESVGYAGTDGLGDIGGTSIDSAETVDSFPSLEVPSTDEVGHAGVAEAPAPLFEEWQPRWASSFDDWSIVEDSGYVGGTALEFEHDGDNRTRYALSWDAIGEHADSEVLDQFVVPEFTDHEDRGFHARVILRGGGRYGSESGYWVEIENREGAFRLAKYVDGSMDTLGHFGEPEPGTRYYRRFRAIDDEIAVKVWQVDENEPDEWDIEINDGDLASGWVGLGSYDQPPVLTDTVSVGVDGEHAPFPTDEDDDRDILTVTTGEATDIGSTSATLAGEVTALGDAEDVTVGIEIGTEPDDDDVRAVESGSMEETGSFTVEVSDLSPETEYSYRATATSESDSTVGEWKTLVTGGQSSPSIENVEVHDISNDSFTGYAVDWDVSHPDGELDTVITKLRSDGQVVNAESTSVSGDREQFSHVLRVRGPVDEVRVSVNDRENQVKTETIDV